MGDGLLPAAVADRLAQRDMEVRQLGVNDVILSSVELDGGRLGIEGEHIDVLAYLPRLDESRSPSVEPSERPFAHVEARAMWLCALQLPSLVVLNRYCEEDWMAGWTWTVWRERVRAGGVPTVPLAFGAGTGGTWLPFGGFRPRPRAPAELRTFTAGAAIVASGTSAGDEPEEVLLAGGQVVEGRGDPPVPAAAQVLRARGISLARLHLVGGAVLAVDPAPVLDDETVAGRCADAIGEELDADLRRR